jgi:amino acid transporter
MLQRQFFRSVKNIVLGPARDHTDRSIFHKLSLIAFFAWVGLGADGLSSSCYGPEEIFRVLHLHPYLAIFVGIGTAITIFVISASYSQIIALFPSGGGGYLVASKLLSPRVGMVSGCSLLIDYVLTIAISIASGVDALFSLMPQFAAFKLPIMIIGVAFLILLNLRGVKESVMVLLPIFLVFVVTHIFVIFYVLGTHTIDLPNLIQNSTNDLQLSFRDLGFFGAMFLMMKAYSMGAGTYTGIEAVSNGMPILREPKIQTAQHTMRYMSVSLAFTAMGLILAYALFKLSPNDTKTLNAVLFERMTESWPTLLSGSFVWLTLASESALLFVAAQTGFLDGPRVLANMAIDRWFPTKFASLSDRFVTHNGVMMMGFAAIAVLAISVGSVHFLVILYSINVFITFSLSQLGMVRHWWNVRKSDTRWKRKLGINGIGLSLTSFILVSVVILKFEEGGWITLLITGSVIAFVSLIRWQYEVTSSRLKHLDALVEATELQPSMTESTEFTQPDKLDTSAPTAVILVSGFNGPGLHTFFTVVRRFKNVYKNFVFLCVGQIDAGNFKGTEEIDNLSTHIANDVKKYQVLAERHGFNAEGISYIGTDVVETLEKHAPEVMNKYKNAIFFGTQTIFTEEIVFSRWLHNYTLFAIQRKLSYQGIPLLVIPIRTYREEDDLQRGVAAAT